MCRRLRPLGLPVTSASVSSGEQLSVCVLSGETFACPFLVHPLHPVVCNQAHQKGLEQHCLAGCMLNSAWLKLGKWQPAYQAPKSEQVQHCINSCTFVVYRVSTQKHRRCDVAVSICVVTGAGVVLLLKLFCLIGQWSQWRRSWQTG